VSFPFSARRVATSAADLAEFRKALHEVSGGEPVYSSFMQGQVRDGLRACQRLGVLSDHEVTTILTPLPRVGGAHPEGGAHDSGGAH
jgi:hypothetical protein